MNLICPPALVHCINLPHTPAHSRKKLVDGPYQRPNRLCKVPLDILHMPLRGVFFCVTPAVNQYPRATHGNHIFPSTFWAAAQLYKLHGYQVLRKHMWIRVINMEVGKPPVCR